MINDLLCNNKNYNNKDYDEKKLEERALAFIKLVNDDKEFLKKNNDEQRKIAKDYIFN